MLLVPFLGGCGAIETNRYSRAVGTQPENGFILRGSGIADDGKYAYELPDVNQVETSDYIVAVQIQNWREVFWAAGPILPVIPTLGLMTEGYDGTVPGKGKGTLVTVAVFGKTEKDLTFNACGILLARGSQQFQPTQVKTKFKNAEQSLSCDSQPGEVTVPGRAPDLFTVELFYPEPVFPGNGLSVSLPEIDCSGDVVAPTVFIFQMGSNTFWTTYL